MTDLTVPQTLLHPLKAKVVGFHEEAEEYSFQVEYPDPPVCTACLTRPWLKHTMFTAAVISPGVVGAASFSPPCC